MCVQVFDVATSSFVRSLASLDVKLEEAGVLGKLEPEVLPEEVLGDDGEPIEAYKEVRAGRLCRVYWDHSVLRTCCP